MRLLHLLLTFLLVLTSMLTGSGPVPRASAHTPPLTSDLQVIAMTATAITLELSIPSVQHERVRYDGQVYDRLHIPGMEQTTLPGSPQVPTRGTLLGISATEGVTVQVLETESETRQGYHLALAPAPPLNDDTLAATAADGSSPVFIPEQYALYPAVPVAVGEVGIMRDQPVAQLQFYPVQYHPATATVQIHRRLRVQITWNATPARATAPPVGTLPAYERLLQATLLNYADLQRPAAVSLPATHATSLAQATVPLSTTSPALKITVSRSGIYRLTASDLAQAGFDLATLDPRLLVLHHRDQERAIYVHGAAAGRFDPQDYLLFYAEAFNDTYTNQNVYWLTVGAHPGRRMALQSGAVAGDVRTPTYFSTTLHAEEDTHYWQSMPGVAGQDRWFWGDRLAAGMSRDYPLSLPPVSPMADYATIRVRLQGRTNDPQVDPDHFTRIYLNGVAIDEQRWNGQIVFDHRVSVPHAALQAGANTLRIENVGGTGARIDQILVNWIAIDYWQTYVAQDEQLLFTAPPGDSSSPELVQFSVTGFAQPDVAVFDVTDTDHVRRITDLETMTRSGQTTLRFAANVQPSSQYLALSGGGYLTPDQIAWQQLSDWKDPRHGADYIIITHADFAASAHRLAEHRRASGLRVAVVDVAEIYNEFNGGIFNPHAIRDFLAYAYQHWVRPAPTYVLLVGDAVQDYKDNLQQGQSNYVPTLLVETAHLGETPTDNLFVAVHDNDILPAMFIGRLAVETADQAEAVVNKIIAYEQSPPDATWNQRVLLVADDGDSAFRANSEQLAARLPSSYTIERVYAEHYPPGNPTSDITSAINTGAILVNYIGHGEIHGWGRWGDNQRIFSSAAARALSNSKRLPVVTVANCLNGYFASAFTVSLAEELQRHPQGGAVAVWAATGLDYPEGHRLLLNFFYDAIFQDHQYTLGAATTVARIKTYTHSPERAALVHTFVLFGDPAQELGIPDKIRPADPADPPFVRILDPADGARDVALNAALHVTFSTPMDPQTVVLHGPKDAGLTFNAAWNADYTQVSFTHTGLAYNTHYTFAIHGRDQAGNALDASRGPRSWSLTTMNQPTPTSTPPSADPLQIALSGPHQGIVGERYHFGAGVDTVDGVTAAGVANTITYAWTATDQSPVVHTTGDQQDAIAFTWQTPGDKMIRVTATTASGTASATHTIKIAPIPEAARHIYLPLIRR